MRLPFCAPLALLLGLAGCSTAIQLTDQGQGVRHITRADMPGGCNLLGDIAIGIPPDAARPRTEEELHILMRNKTGELGGNHLVVDSAQQREDASGNPYYRGRGIGYACPEPEAAAEDGQTSGSEAPDEGAEGDSEATPGEGSQTSAEDDAILDDLLGE